MRKFKIGWREVISMAADAITVSVFALNPALQETLLRGHEPPAASPLVVQMRYHLGAVDTPERGGISPARHRKVSNSTAQVAGSATSSDPPAPQLAAATDRGARG